MPLSTSSFPMFDHPADEFIKALNGESFRPGQYIRRLLGSEILSDSTIRDLLPNGKIEHDEEYVFVRDCNVVLNSWPWVIMISDKTMPNVLLYNASIPVLNLTRSSIGDILILNNSLCNNIVLNESSSCQEIIIDNSKCKNIIAQQESSYRDISIGDKSSCGNIELRDKSMCSYITVFDNSQCANIIADGGKCSGVTLNNGRCANITAIICELFGDINMRNKSQCNVIDIFNINTYGSINIDESQCAVLKMNSHNTFINIVNSKINSLQLTGYYSKVTINNTHIVLAKFTGSYMDELALAYGAVGEFYIDESSITYFNLCNTSISKDAIISITRSKFYKIKIETCIILGQLVFRDINTLKPPFAWESIELKKLKAMSRDVDLPVERIKSIVARIERLETETLNYIFVSQKSIDKYGHIPCLIMADSSMGKTEITGSDLTGFKFEYRDTNMLDMFINGTKFPKEINIYGEDDLLQKTSVYIQLRILMEGMGNIVDATKYNARAMTYQGQYLWNDFKESIEQSFKEAIRLVPNLITFGLNKLSNNHGESWFWALGFIVTVAFIFNSLFFLICHPYQYDLFSYNILWDFLWGWGKYLYPLHKVDLASVDDSMVHTAKMIDYGGRLAVGYGIYQFIAAFRRHGRRQGT